jgi:hypothetical protein
VGTKNERDKLKKFYGPQWASKVDKMSDTQILAIFRKFQREGKIK